MNRGDMRRDLEAIHLSSFGWAMTCCAWDRDDAEEVLQSSYLKALEGRARFDGRSSLRTWFFGVVRKTAQEQRRRRLARSLGLERWLIRRPASEPARTPEKLSGDAEDRQALRRTLARLTPRQRDVIHLVFYEEMTIAEAAGVLGVSLGTARMHYERGKAKARRLLQGAEMNHAEPRRHGTATSRTF